MPVRELVKVVVNTEDVYVVVHLRSEFESSRGLLHRNLRLFGYNLWNLLIVCENLI